MEPEAKQNTEDDLSGAERDDDLSGNELEDADLTASKLNEGDDTGGMSNADVQESTAAAENSADEPSHEKAAAARQSTETGDSLRAKPIKSIIMAAAVVILVSVVGVIGYVLWPTSSDIKMETAAVQAPEKEEIIPISMESFLIPFRHETYSYISLNVAIEVSSCRLRTEIMAQKDFIRGRVYDGLLLYVQDLSNTPGPNAIKTIISESINSALANGSVRDLYVTQFIVI